MNWALVGLLQMASCGSEKERIIAKGEAYCRRAAAMGADIALFPELWHISTNHFVDSYWDTCYDIWRGKNQWNGQERHPDQQF